MPGFTPNYAIPYPCAGEIIDPAVFQAFSDGVESALASVDTLSAAALARPNGAVRNTGQSIAVGAATAIAFTATDFSSGITATGTGFTVLTSGIYEVSMESTSDTVTTTVSSEAVNILVAGVVRLRRKYSVSAGSLTRMRAINLSGLVSLTAGQALTYQFHWTGAGVNLNVVTRATIAKISAV